jgi:hypothetical protein
MGLEDAPQVGDGTEDSPSSGRGSGVDQTPSSTAQRGEFAPADPWDGRKPYEWRSRWERDAKRSMLVDGLYLTAVLLLCPVVLFVLDTEKLKSLLALTPHVSRELALYGSAWMAGMLGGDVFALKWFYHSVARGKWHVDRRAWRIFTPVVSGALAFGTGALFISEVLPIFNPTITRSIGGVTGLSFVVGYFSDNAVAALAATADRVLGPKAALSREPEKAPDGNTGR